MKKILIVGPFSPPITGMSFANDILFENLDRKFFKVDKVNFSYSSFDEDLGVFTFHKLMFFFSKYIYLYKVFFSDVIYITPGQTFLGILKFSPFSILAKVLGKKTVIHIHGNHVYNEYKTLIGLKRKIFSKLISLYNNGIVLSKSLENNLLPFLKEENIFVVENFVDDYILNQVTTEKIQNKEKEKLKILYLSNLMEEKGIFDLLESLLLLKDEGIEFEAVVAGSFDLKNKKRLDGYFKELLPNVNYVGVVVGQEKFDYLLASNIFVFPTYYKTEGQPISILEAMATGNIILTTNHAGIPDICRDNVNGFYIKKKSPKSIFNEIINMQSKLEEYKKVMLLNYEEASTKYTVNLFISKISKVLSK